MTPTRWSTLLSLAVLGVAVGFVLPELYDVVTGRLLPVGWLPAAVLVVFAGAMGWWTLRVRRRLQSARRTAPGRGEEPAARWRPLHPVVLARTAALALATSRVGALVAGVYGGIALAFLDEVDRAAGRGRVVAAVAACLAAVLLAAVGLVLEHVCRLPPPASQEPGAGRGAT